MSESQVKQENRDAVENRHAPYVEHGASIMERDHNVTRRIASGRVKRKHEIAFRSGLSAAVEQFKALRLQISTEGAAKAWRIANAMLDDETTPARTRWDIARTFLLMAGHVPPKPLAPAPANDRPLVERSTNDLRDLVDRLEAELAGRAVPVKTLATQAVDMWS
jgi:hypothetical protein